MAHHARLVTWLERLYRPALDFALAPAYPLARPRRGPPRRLRLGGRDPGLRVPAQARRGLALGAGRHARLDLAHRGRPHHHPGAAAPRQLPRGQGGGLSARPAGRRHRRQRLRHRRVLRRSETARGVDDGARPRGALGGDPPAPGDHPGHRAHGLPGDRGQRQRGGLGDQGRALGENLRPRSEDSSRDRRPGGRGGEAGPRQRRRGLRAAGRPAAGADRRRPARRGALGPYGQRRPVGDRDRLGGRRRHPGARGGADLRPGGEDGAHRGRRPGRHPRPSRPRAQRREAHPGLARQGRRGPRLRAYLPRGERPPDRRQVLGREPRSGLAGRRGAAEGGGRRPPADRLQAGVDGRLREPAAGSGAAPADRAVHLDRLFFLLFLAFDSVRRRLIL